MMKREYQDRGPPAPQRKATLLVHFYSALMVHFYSAIDSRLNPYFNIHLNEGGDLMWELTFRHHRELIAMIKDKKPDLACQCLVNDLTNSGGTLFLDR